MRFDIITIFPEIVKAYFNSSVLARAQKAGKIKINIIDLRKFSTDRHKKIDDKLYGGGPGMVFKIEPLAKAMGSILKISAKSEARNPKQIPKSKLQKSKTLVVLFSPVGKQFYSKIAIGFAKKYNHIVMIAGHYEGVDERIRKVVSDFGFRILDLSIGPYILTGGELPAMVVVDAVSRHIPGVLGKAESLEEKRLGAGVPVYTRPEVFKWRGKKYSVPKILLSGDHKKIEEWREKHQKKNL